MIYNCLTKFNLLEEFLNFVMMIFFLYSSMIYNSLTKTLILLEELIHELLYIVSMIYKSLTKFYMLKGLSHDFYFF